MCFVPAFLVCMNFHDTHFNIGDLPCKSQNCAKLGKFCANGVPWERVISSEEILNRDTSKFCILRFTIDRQTYTWYIVSSQMS